MCGRFTIAAERERVTAALPGITVGEWYGPRFNVAPGQNVPTVLNDGRSAITWLRWGLIPSWAKDPAIGNRLINARAETLATKPSFRTSLQHRRCLIVADGFFEWSARPGHGSRVPHYLTRMDGEPFTFAGLWETWRAQDDRELRTCTIITTEPNELVRTLHDRMPAILPAEARARWLDPAPATAADLLPLLQPYPAALLRVTVVSPRVNRAGVDDPSCIEPAEAPPQLPGFG